MRFPVFLYGLLFIQHRAASPFRSGAAHIESDPRESDPVHRVHCCSGCGTHCTPGRRRVHASPAPLRARPDDVRPARAAELRRTAAASGMRSRPHAMLSSEARGTSSVPGDDLPGPASAGEARVQGDASLSRPAPSRMREASVSVDVGSFVPPGFRALVTDASQLPQDAPLSFKFTVSG